MNVFTRSQIKKLVGKLDRAHVHSRAVDGRKLDYIEGWFAVSEANAIFGFAGWDREMVHFERVFESRVADETSCAYLARVRVTVRAPGHAVIREGTGFGQARARLRGEAHERALKVAETDATKRALATFGNRLGLALYDKDQNGVAERSTDKAKPQSLGVKVGASLAKSAAVTDMSGCEPGIEGAVTANIFVLRDAGGELLARALSGEGFCTGLRQLIEAYKQGGDLDRLKLHNGDMLALLRSARPALRSSKGEHFADILERLIAKKRGRLGAGSGAVSPPAARRAREQVLPSQIGERSKAVDATPPPHDRAATNIGAERAAVVRDAAPREGVLTGLTALSGAEYPAATEPGTKDDTTTVAASGPGYPKGTAPDTGSDIMDGATVGGPAKAMAANNVLRPTQSPEPSQRPSRLGAGSAVDKSSLLIATVRRVRHRDHLNFVARKPCLICEVLPCHAHHVTFAQPRGLSLKVSDEFTVPLCAVHHNTLHASGDERAFWRRHGIDPLVAARQLWLATLGNQSQTGV